MSNIFISHSGANNGAALALAQWLAEFEWDEYFLDISPSRGLAPGERWQKALKSAADRCEAVLFLISPAWRDSRCLKLGLEKAELDGALMQAVFDVYFYLNHHRDWDAAFGTNHSAELDRWFIYGISEGCAMRKYRRRGRLGCRCRPNLL